MQERKKLCEQEQHTDHSEPTANTRRGIMQLSRARHAASAKACDADSSISHMHRQPQQKTAKITTSLKNSASAHVRTLDASPFWKARSSVRFPPASAFGQVLPATLLELNGPCSWRQRSR